MKALVLFFFALAFIGCAPSPKHVASNRIVATGGALDDLRRANVAVFKRETDVLIESGATVEALAPLEREFTARTHAIATASDALFALARALDRTQDPKDASVQEAARDAADALELAVDVCRDEHALAAVPIPRRLHDQMDALRVLAGQITDGGLGHG